MLSAVTPPTLATEPTVQNVRALAEAGAAGLALRRVDARQPAATDEPQAWARWERLRYDILRQTNAWQALTRRSSRMPAQVPADFRHWARTQAAKGHLQLGEGRAALAVLRSLLWLGDAPPDAETQRRFRRLVVRGYLAAGYARDAHTAALRYQQDYGPGQTEWIRLRARVLLKAGQPGHAAEVLDDLTSPEDRALRLLARLRAGEQSPQASLDTARGLAGDEQLAPGVRVLAWMAVAEAARAAGRPKTRIRALEQLLALPVTARQREALVAGLGDADALWRAYLDYGYRIGNRRQLLRGDDAGWYQAASTLHGQAPVEARALFAVLALRSDSPTTRHRAHEQLVQAVLEAAGGEPALSALYLEASRFDSVGTVPAPARYRLAEWALGRTEIELASRLMAGLDTPPEGADPRQWRMRKARVLILGGRPDEGIQTLKTVLDAPSALSLRQVDRLLQVVFDLQSLDRHQAALDLFGQVGKAPLDPRRQRELLFWRADSHKALGHHEKAGLLYLRSATRPGPQTMDPWARTARFHAAQMLDKAGLGDDARRLYRGLLAATDDPGRRAVLQRRLEHVGPGGGDQ